MVETVGAGISGLLEKLIVAETVKRGNAIWASTVMSPGDMDGLSCQEILFAQSL